MTDVSGGSRRMGVSVGPQVKKVPLIIQVVEAYFDLDAGELVGRRKEWVVTGPRQIAMTLAYRETTIGLSEVGRRFGGRDHTTVMHARNVVAERRKASAEYDADFRAIDALVVAELGKHFGSVAAQKEGEP